MRSEWGRITHEVGEMKQSIKNNTDKGSWETFLDFLYHVTFTTHAKSESEQN